MDDRATDSRTQMDVGVLAEFLNTLGSLNTDLILRLHSGQKLCHYTSLEGAIGIITAGDLHLTNLRYSNDDEEMNYGRRLIDEVIGDLEKEATADAPRTEFLAKLRARLESARDAQVYICCFCQKENLLSQWRGYADNGGALASNSIRMVSPE
jgi:hypothetical protein